MVTLGKHVLILALFLYPITVYSATETVWMGGEGGDWIFAFDQGRIKGISDWGYENSLYGLTIKSWSSDDKTNFEDVADASITTDCTAFSLSANEYIDEFRVISGIYNTFNVLRFLGFGTSDSRRFECKIPSNIMSLVTDTFDTQWTKISGASLIGFEWNTGHVIDGLLLQFEPISPFVVFAPFMHGGWGGVVKQSFDQGRINAINAWGYGASYAGIMITDWSSDEKTVANSFGVIGELGGSCTPFTLTDDQYIHGYRVKYVEDDTWTFITYIGFQISDGSTRTCVVVPEPAGLFDTGWMDMTDTFLSGVWVRSGGVIDQILFQFTETSQLPAPTPTIPVTPTPTTSTPTTTSPTTSDPTAAAPTTSSPTTAEPTTATPTTATPTTATPTTSTPTTSTPTTSTPTTSTPTTTEPTNDPTNDPTADPTNDPTVDPTNDPTVDPTADPTDDPSNDPTTDPTIDPTSDPTMDPTTDRPTNFLEFPNTPTMAPTMTPTEDEGSSSMETSQESNEEGKNNDNDTASSSLIDDEGFLFMIIAVSVFLIVCFSLTGCCICYRKNKLLQEKVTSLQQHEVGSTTNTAHHHSQLPLKATPPRSHISSSGEPEPIRVFDLNAPITPMSPPINTSDNPMVNMTPLTPPMIHTSDAMINMNMNMTPMGITPMNPMMNQMMNNQANLLRIQSLSVPSNQMMLPQSSASRSKYDDDDIDDDAIITAGNLPPSTNNLHEQAENYEDEEDDDDLNDMWSNEQRNNYTPGN